MAKKKRSRFAKRFDEGDFFEDPARWAPTRYRVTTPRLGVEKTHSCPLIFGHLYRLYAYNLYLHLQLYRSAVGAHHLAERS